MSAWSYGQIAIACVGLLCLLYALREDGWLNWAKETFGPLATRDGLKEIADAVRQQHAPVAQRHEASRLPYDVDARSALLYAANRTWAPRPYNEPVNSGTAAELQRVFDALDLFYASASHDGGLRVWGRTSMTRPHKLVEPTHWQDWHIDYTAVFADPDGEPLRTVPRDRLRLPSSPPYHDLRLNKAEVERVWPHSPTSLATVDPPRLRVDFSVDLDGCRRQTAFNSGVRAAFYRLWVRPGQKGRVSRECTGTLVDIMAPHPESGSLISVWGAERLRLTWATHTSPPVTSINIRNEHGEFLDVFFVTESGVIGFGTPGFTLPAGLNFSEFKPGAAYVLCVILDAEEHESREVKLHLLWPTDWQNVDVKMTG